LNKYRELHMSFKILVVDDEKTVGTGISRHLAKDGYQTFWVRTGEEALDKLVHFRKFWLLLLLLMETWKWLYRP